MFTQQAKEGVRDVAIVIRTYSNNPDIKGAVERARKFRRAKLIIVVVKDEDSSHRGAVGRALASISDDRVVVREMQWGYTWANALNAAASEVFTRNDLDPLYGIKYLVPVSVEVLWEGTHLQKMLEQFDDALLGELFVVGTTFEGVHRSNKVDLGPTYLHPRNTFAAYSVSGLRRVGGWSAACDAMGGMEDAMSLLLAETQCLTWKQLDLKVRLILGKNWSQADKELREKDAIAKIGVFLTAIAKYAPERYREFCRRIGMDPGASG